MDPMPTYRIPMSKDRWAACSQTLLTMWDYRERMGCFPQAAGNWSMVDAATYKIPFRPQAWSVGQGFISVHVEFSHELSAARGAALWVIDAIGEMRSTHRAYPRGVQPGIVDMMPTIHPDHLSLLTEADVFAVVQLLNEQVMAKA